MKTRREKLLDMIEKTNMIKRNLKDNELKCLIKSLLIKSKL